MNDRPAELFSVRGAARWLSLRGVRVHENTIRNWVKTARIPSQRVARELRDLADRIEQGRPSVEAALVWVIRLVADVTVDHAIELEKEQQRHAEQKRKARGHGLRWPAGGDGSDGPEQFPYPTTDELRRVLQDPDA